MLSARSSSGGMAGGSQGAREREIERKEGGGNEGWEEEGGRARGGRLEEEELPDVKAGRIIGRQADARACGVCGQRARYIHACKREKQGHARGAVGESCVGVAGGVGGMTAVAGGGEKKGRAEWGSAHSRSPLRLAEGGSGVWCACLGLYLASFPLPPLTISFHPYLFPIPPSALSGKASSIISSFLRSVTGSKASSAAAAATTTISSSSARPSSPAASLAAAGAAAGAAGGGGGGGVRATVGSVAAAGTSSSISSGRGWVGGSRHSSPSSRRFGVS
ncbi:unnamed protein product [Closterium sp. NIES-54]